MKIVQYKLMVRNIMYLLVFVCFLSFLANTQHTHTFAEWKSQHSKNYNDKIEETYRTYIYNQNLRQIDVHNSNPQNTHTEAPNQFSDLTLQQFSHLYLTAIPPQNEPIVGQQSDQKDKQEPTVKIVAIDHTALYRSAATVKNQGPCGSCYAFSTTSQIQYQYLRTSGNLVTFSPQELVDCSHQFGNNGCNGGWLDHSYAYMVFNYIARQSDYPYTAAKGQCKKNAINRGPAKLVSRWITGSGCDVMLAQLQKTTIAAAVWASSNAFKNYKNGIISAEACLSPAFRVNHGILLVGNDAAGNMKIQNSWGKRYGDQGYVWVGANNACNICQSGGFYGSF